MSSMFPVPEQDQKGAPEVDLHLRYDQPKQTVAAGEVIFGAWR